MYAAVHVTVEAPTTSTFGTFKCIVLQENSSDQ